MSSILGGNSSGQTNSAYNSQNQAFGQLSSALSPTVNSTGQASNQVQSMLGLNGASGQNQAFQNYQNSAGYQNLLNTGSQAVSNNQAASGLLGSGSTGTALTAYGQNYANNFLQNYMGNLNNSANTGVSAANALSGSGNIAQSLSAGNNSSKQGLGL